MPSRSTRRRLAHLPRQPARLVVAVDVRRCCSCCRLCAELIANDRPMLVRYDGALLRAGAARLSRDDVRRRLPDRGRLHRPRAAGADRQEAAGCSGRRSPTATTRVDRDLGRPAPLRRRRASNWLGTDDQARDVLARVIYGFRISVLFGLIADHRSARSIGIAAGAVQGYLRRLGRSAVPALPRDLVGLPMLYLLIILASFIAAELLDAARHHAAVLLDGAGRRGARRVPARPQPRLRPRRPGARRAATSRIMFRHILPNAMVATLTFLPFILTGSVDHADRARLPRLRPAAGLALAGRAAAAGQEQPAGALARPSPASSCSAAMLTLLIFIGEAVRDAFDPRKVLA